MLNAIALELQLVDAKIKEGLIIKKSGHAAQFAHIESSQFGDYIRPAITILSGKLFNYKREKIVVLASIMQFIYMAFQIQANITEEDTLPENGDVRDGCQFPVLVGDYLYGKFFRLLSDANLIEYLSPLANIICSINEGATIRYQHPSVSFNTDPDVVEKIVHNETAVFFAGCAAIAAEMCDASETQIETMYNFGFNFGLGYGLLEQGVPYECVEQYFNKAILLLQSFSNDKISDFVKLTNMFKHPQSKARKMVG